MMFALFLMKGSHAFKGESIASVLSVLIVNTAGVDFPLRETWKGKTNSHGLQKIRTFISQNYKSKWNVEDVKSLLHLE